jgi:hypothetical protein
MFCAEVVRDSGLPLLAAKRQQVAGLMSVASHVQAFQFTGTGPAYQYSAMRGSPTDVLAWTQHPLEYRLLQV